LPVFYTASLTLRLLHCVFYSVVFDTAPSTLRCPDTLCRPDALCRPHTLRRLLLSNHTHRQKSSTLDIALEYCLIRNPFTFRLSVQELSALTTGLMSFQVLIDHILSFVSRLIEAREPKRVHDTGRFKEVTGKERHNASSDLLVEVRVGGGGTFVHSKR